MKLWNLAVSYMRGSRSSVISLFLMILTAGILLNVSLAIALRMPVFFDEKFEKLHEPDVNLLLHRADERPEYEDYIRRDSRVAAFEREAVVWSPSARFSYGDGEMSIGVAVQRAGLDRRFAPMKLVEELAGAETADGIYVPYGFKLNAGYRLGDPFTLHMQDERYEYTIVGFFESAMMGIPNTGIIKFFLPETGFAKLEEEGAGDGALYSVKLHEREQIAAFLTDYRRAFPDPPGRSVYAPLFAEMDSETVKSVGSMTINIITMILLAFALVIIGVTLIVIQYRVGNHIAEGMNHIGVLKALGYTGLQIVLSLLLQFALIALSAGALGTAVSYAVLPVFGSVVTTLSGLLWSGGFLPVVNLMSMALILLMIVSVVGISAVRIFRLPPVVALRGGIVTHNFKKNRIPLDRARGPLHLLLACKTAFMNVKQTAMIAVIVAAITFASVFAVVLYYNIAKENTAFIHLIGAETSDIVLQIADEADRTQLLANLERTEHVAKVAVLDMTSMNIDGQTFYMNISDDYGKMNNQLVYEGRYPKYDNEIAVSWIVADLLGKSIGDTVEVAAGPFASSYLITGMSQSISNLGQMAYLTAEGARRVLPQYEETLVNLYLEGTDNASFSEALKAQYGRDIANLIDVTETIEGQSKVYTSAALTIMVTVLAITVLVVVLILYLVIKKMIVQRKKEFGLLRAVGFTTFQLVSQLSLSFLPVVALSVLAGGILGALYTNPLLALLLAGAGIRNVQFVVNVPLIALIGVALVVVSYAISLIVSYGIKNIATRRLMIEE